MKEFASIFKSIFSKSDEETFPLSELRAKTKVEIREESPTLVYSFPDNFEYGGMLNPIEQKGEKLFAEFKKSLLKYFDTASQKKIKNQFSILRAKVAGAISSRGAYGDDLIISLYSKGEYPSDKNGDSAQHAEAWVHIIVTNDENSCIVRLEVSIRCRWKQEVENTDLIAISDWKNIPHLVDTIYKELTQR